MRSLSLAAVIGLLLSGNTAAQEQFTTKELAAACNEFLTKGSSGADPASLCVVYFTGWTAAFTLGVNGKTDDGKPIYGICEPEHYSVKDVIREFVGVVRKYPNQFEQPIFNDPMYAVPYSLKQVWPCVR